MVKVFEGTPQEYYMDGYLKQNLDTARHVIKSDWDMLLLYDGYEGCLSGDTVIRTNRFTLGRKFTIKYIYNQYHSNPDKMFRMKGWNLQEPTYIRAFDGNKIRLHKILDVVYSGKKEVWLLALEDGKTIKATKDHLFLTQDGWIELQNLNLNNHQIMCDTPKAKASSNHTHRFHDIQIGGLLYHPYGGTKRIAIHRVIYEAYLNNLTFNEFIKIISCEPVRAHELKYINPQEFVIHHKDFNHYNNDMGNLELVSPEQHLILHAKFNYDNFGQGIPIFMKIKSIEPVGIEDVYDIKAEEPYHNFSANDIIVHNCGKSTLCMQNAFYCDSTLTLDRVTFNPKEFRKAILEAKKYQAVIYDEAYTGLNSRATMSMINRVLVSMLAEIRQKNLFVFVVMPTFFDLDKYVALWRSRALIHVYTGDNFQRGYFAFFNADKKKELYVLGKKFYNYSKPKYNFIGRFTNHYVVDEAAYRLKKLESLKRREAEAAAIEIRIEAQNQLFNRVQETDVGLTHNQKMELLGMKPSNYYIQLRKWSENRQ